MRQFLLTFGFTCLTVLAFAQWSPGFRAGLNLSTISGPTDLGSSVGGMETNGNITGFHVGGSMRYEIIEDLLSAQIELMYSQKGTDYSYRGQATQFFTSRSGNNILATGPINYSVNVTNSYLDFPLVVNVRALKWLEFTGGVNAGILVASLGTGSKIFQGTTTRGTMTPEFNISLDNNYGSDEPGEFKGADGDIAVFDVNFEQFEVPTVQGAYFDHQDDYGSLYNRLDFGLIGGVSLYLNQSLFLGFRANYGLTDVTRNEADRSLVELDSNDVQLSSDDKDRNISLQASIGFSF